MRTQRNQQQHVYENGGGIMMAVFPGHIAAAWIVATLACSEPPREFLPLAGRTGPPDTSRITDEFRARGGLAWLTLTGWPDSVVVAELEAAGLAGPPGHEQPARLPGMNMNMIAGVISPGGLDRVAAIQYVVKIEPAQPPNPGRPERGEPPGRPDA